MPMESPIAKALSKARDAAELRGHKLGGWSFGAGQGAASCTRDGCGGTILVTPGSALEIVGVCYVLPCRAGGNAQLEAPAPIDSPGDGIAPELAQLAQLERAAIDEAPNVTAETLTRAAEGMIGAPIVWADDDTSAPAQTPQPRPQPTREQLKQLSLKSFGRRAAQGVR